MLHTPTLHQYFASIMRTPLSHFLSALRKSARTCWTETEADTPFQCYCRHVRLGLVNLSLTKQRPGLLSTMQITDLRSRQGKQNRGA